MRRAVLTIAVASLPLAACHFTVDSDDGPAHARNFPVSAFTKLVIAGPYQVTVQQGPTAAVAAKGSESALEAVVVEVKDGELAIHPTNRHFWNWGWRHFGKVDVTVTVPVLEEATIAGSGNITVAGLAVPSFKGAVAGSGNLNLSGVDAQSIDLAIAGSGDIRAAGKAKDVSLTIAGSGDIDTAKLITETAKVSIVGSGDIKANATGTADLDIMGSGDITVTGGAKCTVTKGGSGEAHCS